MKKVGLVLVSAALFAFITLSSCGGADAAKKLQEAADEAMEQLDEAVEEAVEEVADSLAADSTAVTE